MWQQEFTWFFALFHHEFRQGNRIAFEVLMALAFAHIFGFFNPKQLADFLDIPHQKLYAQLKDWSVYYLKEMLLRYDQASSRASQACFAEKCGNTVTSRA